MKLAMILFVVTSTFLFILLSFLLNLPRECAVVISVTGSTIAIALAKSLPASPKDEV